MTEREALALLGPRVGRVQRAEPNERARKPACKLWVDLGPTGVRRSAARITGPYSPAELSGRLVVAGVRLGARNVAGFPSEVLVLGLPDEKGRVAPLAPDRDVSSGHRVF